MTGREAQEKQQKRSKQLSKRSVGLTEQKGRMNLMSREKLEWNFVLMDQDLGKGKRFGNAYRWAT